MIRAIIADDEQAVASIICHFIEKECLPIKIVGTAADGRQAVKLIKEEHPELIFLDIQMPIMNGFEVMKAETEPHFIIITAYESFQYAQQALRLGACDIILKPIEYKQFLQAINRAIGWKFTSNTTVNGILEYIHLNYAQKISLEQLAQMFYTTPSHIARLFKGYMDLSIVTYIHQVRIKEAKKLLMEQCCSVKDTAERTGYDSLNNFYKYFKMYTGMTPATFIQQNKDL
ncbi:response regulator [Sporomusa sp. KB1]|jgi:YesN/AraC family two-component response regulator|uniref:response regulator transcription factor n=1 Tax=Sporomusa sp. KB1 TaxID=943346 RepID=UPI00119D80E7|nr:response regulator [Sporomusa sp. KB1]TWH45791.1 Response regulator containing CheY-like receiver domain and AraC-type DNA-binding domain [Sporomusa sp. KB1]